MAGNTYIGHGTKFAIKVASSFVDVDGVSDINFGSNKIDVTDTTDMTTAGTTRTFQPGLENPGECTIKLNHKPGNVSQGNLATAKATATVQDFKVTYTAAAGGGSEAFSGIIVGIDRAIPDDKPATLSCKIQITGPVVFTPGA